MPEPTPSTLQPQPQQAQQQEQPTRPPTFNTTAWSQTDASFLEPTTLPLAKAPRAWERQPQSPKARNGRYRKVWRRYEMRARPGSQQKQEQQLQQLSGKGQSSPAKSPKKVVKRRALDTGMETNVTPGRVRPKNKQFEATSWERRQSGLLPRKLAFVQMDKPRALDRLGGYGQLESPRKSGRRQSRRLSRLEPETLFDAGRDSRQDARGLDMAEDAGAADAELPAETMQTLEEAEVEGSAARVSEDTTAQEPINVESTIKIDSHAESIIEEDEEPQHLLDGAQSESTDEAQTSQVVYPDAMVCDIPEGSENDCNMEATETLANADEPYSTSRLSGETGSEEIVASELIEAHESMPVGETSDHGAYEEQLFDSIEKPVEPIQVEAQHDVKSSTDEDILLDSQEEIQSPQEDAAQDTMTSEPIEPAVHPEITTTEVKVDVRRPDEAPRENSGETSIQEETLEENGDSLMGEAAELQRETEDANTGPNNDVSTNSPSEAADEEEEEDAEDLSEVTLNFGDLASHTGDDIPSPSLSVAESPRFTSIADTLTLNLPSLEAPQPSVVAGEEDKTEPLDADTAFLRDFLSRAESNKATRTASMARRESMENRRDSDVVRQALASPRVALENKDLNSPIRSDVSPMRRGKSKGRDASPSAKNLLSNSMNAEEDMTATLVLDLPPMERAEEAAPAPTPSNRRSGRARAARTPTAVGSSTPLPTPNRIAVRRADGTEPVALKKSEAQELATVTRTNTRRNKGGALAAPIRLNKLKAESLKATNDTPAAETAGKDITEAKEVFLASRVRWDQQLVYFQDQGGPMFPSFNSLSEDELAMDAVPALEKSAVKKAVTPSRPRKVRATNGTPAKGLLAPSSLLPTDVQSESQTAKPSSKQTSGKAAKTKEVMAAKDAPVERVPASAPSSDSASTTQPAEEAKLTDAEPLKPTAASQKKSRLATPKKVKLPVPVSSGSATAPPNAAASTVPSVPPSKIASVTAKKIPVPKAAAAGLTETHIPTAGLGVGAGRRRAARSKV